MDLIRRDTDYAFRIAAHLACTYSRGETVSTRILSKDNQVPAALTSKILQKLAAAGLVISTMGPKGGFRLAKEPGRISFGDLIEAIQGPVSVNKCLMGGHRCPLMEKCPARSKLAPLQGQINTYLKELTLQEFTGAEKNG